MEEVKKKKEGKTTKGRAFSSQAESEETKLVPAEQMPQSLVLAGDPEKQVQYGQKAAKALMAVMRAKPKKVIINGEQYLEYEDWQTIARFFGASVGVDWTKPIMRRNTDGEIQLAGYEAKANVLMNDNIISSAEAMCMFKEKNWTGKDEFMLRSMAQTRASAKALRNVFGWIPVLEGLKATPSEEMPADKVSYVDQTPQESDCRNCGGQGCEACDARKVPAWRKDEEPLECVKCMEEGAQNPIIPEVVHDYSVKHFGVALCRHHQPKK